MEQLSQEGKIIAVVGNPNVGKSTVFNALTGLNQHTGNWTGKTVCSASGKCRVGENEYILVDLPGTYSLIPHSREEEVSRDFVCFEKPDAVIVVCDAGVLERNLCLVLQTLEVTSRVVVCVNLLDEAEKKKIFVNTKKLSEVIGIPVVPCVAREGKGLDELMSAVEKVCAAPPENPYKVLYSKATEEKIAELEKELTEMDVNPRWAAVKLLEGTPSLCEKLSERAKIRFVCRANEEISDEISAKFIEDAEEIAKCCVKYEREDFYERDRKLDRVLTSRKFGIPIMILLLLVVFWITIEGANIPSGLLSDFLMSLSEPMRNGMTYIGIPAPVSSALVDGVWRVLAWVVSVMLPPMAIFFPLFTLLEDFGYLPRIAFNLDKHFRKACTCGKQALTMCMGFGCNAAGVTGCRIIDSPRERLIAIITNSMVPCNGRFPAIISVISLFLVAGISGALSSFLSAVFLTLVILLGVVGTLLTSRLLSKTILKGVPSSFALELPPYRRPQILKVLVRSLLDRTIFVLARAVAVAAPAGLVIWLLANITTGSGATLLSLCSEFLDPLGNIIGLDGTILLAFILGFPANEIVVPIIIMSYMATGSISEISPSEMSMLFTNNGWTVITAVCFVLFSLFHFPCSTTCITIFKETKSIRWTAVAFILPTIIGGVLCAAVALVGRVIF